MILVSEMPKSGQFVAVWTNESGIWSDSYIWEDGKVLKYNEVDDNWETCKALSKIDTRSEYVYFIKKESENGI